MIIRTMLESDIDFALQCSVREGWRNQSRHLFQSSLQYDRVGCVIGEEDGQRIGLCIAVAYAECGFIGQLIVVPGWRKRGLGRQLLEHCIDYLKGRGCRSVYLDAVEEALPLYEQLGFARVCRSLRFYGQIQGRSHAHVKALSPAEMETVAHIDTEAFGADRSFFLDYWHRLCPEHCRATYADGKLTAFCFCQPGDGVVSIGPWLIVDKTATLIDLLESVAAETEGEELSIGTLELNAHAARELRAVDGLVETDYSWRMVLGPNTRLGVSDQLYAIGGASKG